MLSILLTTWLACSFGTDDGPGPDPVSRREPVKGAAGTTKGPKTKNTVPLNRAVAGAKNVTVPTGTHGVEEDPTLLWSDLNAYPAGNVVILQGAAKGPIGSHSSATAWLVGVHPQPHIDANGPSHLEVVVNYAVDCDDCPGDETITAKIESRRSTPEKPASLMGVESMTVEDVDKDGQYEILATARFRPCCDGDEDRRPYSEQVLINVAGDKITHSAHQKSPVKK